MKKVFILSLLACFISLFVVGCGKTEAPTETQAPGTTTQTPTTQAPGTTVEITTQAPGTTTQSNKALLKFEVDIPKLEDGDYTYVIFGSFSDWKLLASNVLTKEGNKYYISLEFEIGTTIEYKYAILGANDTDTSNVEQSKTKTDIENRTGTADGDKTITDKVERFKDVLLHSEVIEYKNLLDNTFYDNDRVVHTMTFEGNTMKVDYSKAEGRSYACIIRPIQDDEINRLDNLTIVFKGEEGVTYLFKVEGGDSPQENYVVATGAEQTVEMKISESAHSSKRLVIFAHPGKTGTTAEPLTGSYEIYSIVATLKNFDSMEPEEYVEGENPIHILAIGNSFSDDGLWLIYDILKQLGYDDIIVANLYIGGCTVATHKDNLQNDRAAYTYRVNKDGTWNSKESKKASYALAEYRWDFISLQQASNYSGLEEYYVTADIDYIYQYAYDIAKEKNPNVQFVWQMTWAYQQNSTHSAFPYYNKDQMTMYNGIIGATQNKIVPDKFNPIVVPSGTTIQNLRTTYLGDTITRDGYHLNEGFGRFAAALTWALKLTGKSIDDVKGPASVLSKYVPLCKECAKNAIAKPFEITNSEFTEDTTQQQIDLSKLVELDQSEYIIGNGYYNSQDASKYMTPIQDSSDFCNGFITTKLMTKEDLPIGSVIVLSSGYQYRPEGWVDEARQTSRNNNTTEAQVLVDEDWWSNYIYRAFNLSKVGGGVLTGDAYTAALASFKIYVPKPKPAPLTITPSAVNQSSDYVDWSNENKTATLKNLKNTITGGQWGRWDYTIAEDLGYTKVTVVLNVTPGLKIMAKLDSSATPKNNAYDGMAGNKTTLIADETGVLTFEWDLDAFAAAANAAGIQYTLTNLTKFVFFACDGTGNETVMTSATIELVSITLS